MTARLTDLQGPHADLLHDDLLVIGAGAAGLSCALAARGARVRLITKTHFGEGGNSPWAQGGVAAAMGDDDSSALHALDTMAAGAHLCRADIVGHLTQEAPARIRRLIEVGTRFDRDAGGTLALGREAAHSRPRILHANGDATGAEIVRALSAAVRNAAHVTIEDGTRVDELVVVGGRVIGAWTRDAAGRRWLRLARAVVLATGGSGQVFLHTTNPPEATGDGLVLAARAGAVLADLEFVQFHPTALAVDADPLPLVTEALRGAGALLVDEHGRRFVLDLHPDGELGPRDVVARAAWAHAAAGHRVLLDARAAGGAQFPSRYPSVYDACRRHGIDPRVDLIPVTPAAHYHMGGVYADAQGRTSLPGLWACGEVACTGVHGANRLASNSLLEALVFGAGVADAIAAGAPPAAAGLVAAHAGVGDPPRPEVAAADVSSIRRLMWDRVGLVRDATGLASAIRDLAALEAGAASQPARDLALVGRLVAASARAREESRGAHWRADWPEARDAWRRRSFVRLAADGAVEPVSEPDVAAAGRSERAAVAAGSAA